MATLHDGKLSAEARARRAIKNSRNRNRTHPVHPVHHHDMPVPGSNKVVTTRMGLKGNRRARGLN